VVIDLKYAQCHETPLAINPTFFDLLLKVLVLKLVSAPAIRAGPDPAADAGHFAACAALHWRLEDVKTDFTFEGSDELFRARVQKRFHDLHHTSVKIMFFRITSVRK